MWILIIFGIWLSIVLFRKWKEEKELEKWVHEHQHDTDEEPDKKEHSVFSTDIVDMYCDPSNVYFQNTYNQD